MKRILITAFAISLLVACNSGGDAGKDADKKDEKKSAETSLSDNPDYAAGLELVNSNGCFTCHKVDEKLTGPSYRDVANKYASQAPGIIPTLADKIIKGGTGNWGQIPMQAHPDLSTENAEKMVKYILLLKTN